MENVFAVQLGHDTIHTIISSDPLFERSGAKTSGLIDLSRQLFLIAADVPEDRREDVWFALAQRAFYAHFQQEMADSQVDHEMPSWTKWANQVYKKAGGRRALNALSPQAGFAKPKPVPVPTPVEPTAEQVEAELREAFEDLTDPQYEAAKRKWTEEGLDPRGDHFRVHEDTTPEGPVIRLILHLAGYHAIAKRVGGFSGADEETFENDENGLPDVARMTVYRMIDGHRVAFHGKFVTTSIWGPDKSKWRDIYREHPHACAARRAEKDGMTKAYRTEVIKATLPVPVRKTLKIAS